MKRQDGIALAKRLHTDGWSYGMIARRFSVSKGTAWNYVNRTSGPVELQPYQRPYFTGGPGRAV